MYQQIKSAKRRLPSQPQSQSTRQHTPQRDVGIEFYRSGGAKVKRSAEDTALRQFKRSIKDDPRKHAADPLIQREQAKAKRRRVGSRRSDDKPISVEQLRHLFTIRKQQDARDHKQRSQFAFYS